LGLAAKTRPVLIISVPLTDEDYALVQVIPHTTSARGARFEAEIPVRFLKQGVFNVQGMMAVPTAKFLRRLGTLSSEQMMNVESLVKQWLMLTD